MKFKILEAINKYYRLTLYDDGIDEEVSFFRGLGEYIEELYNSYDDNYEYDGLYDDINNAFSKLEYVLEVPNLDYKNNNYNFAFTKKAFDTYKDIFDDLFYYVDEYTPFDIIKKEVDLDDKDIIYKDDFQVCWKI